MHQIKVKAAPDIHTIQKFRIHTKYIFMCCANVYPCRMIVLYIV
jgi:hypothetical protein